MMSATLGLFLFAASAPSPLYALYAAVWHFTPLTLTEVFAVYALALLAALLLAGSLSDTLGRRPVIGAALVLQALAMVFFVSAQGVTWLFAARITQGLATGIMTSAVSAALFDLQPADAPRLASLVNSLVPGIGLALGAVIAGALVEYGPFPMRLIYLLMLAALFVVGAALLRMEEPHPGGRGLDLRPRVGVPAGVRPAFASVLPCLVAVWALGGFYLSLGPSVVLMLAGSHNRLLGGVAVLALAGSGAAASLLVSSWTPARAMTWGTAALAVGLLGTIASILIGSAALFLVTTVLAGIGFGVAFLGAFRSLSALAPPEGRGALIAAIYVVAYLAFSLPSIGAGLAATHVGLRTTAVWFGAALVVMALVGLVATRVTIRSEADLRRRMQSDSG
jgi:hypothetical protein